MVIPVPEAAGAVASARHREEPLVPTDRECLWTKLDPAAKRERLLCAAAEVFTSEGLDASMPAVAAAAGAGVASIYRQFPSKRELLAALVVRRLDQIADAASRTAESEGDRFTALVSMLWTVVESQSYDDFVGEARVQVAEHPDVVRAGDRCAAALERLLEDARAEGRLRADATSLDLRLLFAATRAAKKIEPTAWRRTLELFIDALRRDPHA